MIILTNSEVLNICKGAYLHTSDIIAKYQETLYFFRAILKYFRSQDHFFLLKIVIADSKELFFPQSLISISTHHIRNQNQEIFKICVISLKTTNALHVNFLITSSRIFLSETALPYLLLPVFPFSISSLFSLSFLLFIISQCLTKEHTVTTSPVWWPFLVHAKESAVF